MIHRTKTGRALKGPRGKGRGRKTAKSRNSPLAHLGALTWAFGLLTVSVALAAAAVFTKKPF